MQSDSRVLTTVSDRGAFTLLVPLFARTDEIDMNFDVLSNEPAAQQLFSFVGIGCLLWIRDPVTKSPWSARTTTFELRKKKPDLGPLVELNCNRCSLPPSLSTTEIWSALQTRMTVASNVRALPSGCNPLDLVEVIAAGTLAKRQSLFSLATFSAARSCSMPPPLASMPTCQSTSRASPANTKCWAIFPAGCRTMKAIY
jgi:hypothetical protein